MEMGLYAIMFSFSICMLRAMPPAFDGVLHYCTVY